MACEKRMVLWNMLSLLLFLVVVPYAVVEMLFADVQEKLESFDFSYFDNAYCKDTPKENLQGLYVLGDCEYGVMVDLQWDASNAE